MARRKVTYEPLSDVQERALTAYQEWAGGGWKLRLTADWMRGGSDWYPGGDLDYCVLHRLRNTHGPKWLMAII